MVVGCSVHTKWYLPGTFIVFLNVKFVVALLERNCFFFTPFGAFFSVTLCCWVFVLLHFQTTLPPYFTFVFAGE